MIRIAKKKASESNHHAFKMGAVIVKGNRILASACNQLNRGSAVIQDKRWHNSLHAEAGAILMLLKKNRLSDLAGSTLYVTRINRVGQLLLSKPCEFCLRLADSVGIKQIIYTDGNGDTQVL